MSEGVLINVTLVHHCARLKDYFLITSTLVLAPLRGLHFLVVSTFSWSPLSRGLLTRPVRHAAVPTTEELSARQKGDPTLAAYPGVENNNAIITCVEEVSKKKGISMAQVALSWSLSRPFISALLIGTSSLDNLRDLVDALNVSLSEEEVKYLEELYTPKAIFGHS